MNQVEVDESGIPYISTNSELGQTWVVHNWLTAANYCGSQGWRLPTKDELLAHYSAKGNLSNSTGWPTFISYSSSTVVNAGSHYSVSLSDGSNASHNDNNNIYLTSVH